MGRILCIANHGFGTGKTTTAVNLAACFGAMEKKTLLVDFDPNGDSTRFCRLKRNYAGKSLFDSLTNQATPEEVIVDTGMKFLKLAPSKPNLIGVESKIADINPEGGLNNFIKEIKSSFEYIIIDTPSELGYHTVSAIAASENLIIPSTSRLESMKGVMDLLSHMRMNKDSVGAGFKVAGILFVKCNKDDQIMKKIPFGALQKFREAILSTTIPYDSGLRTAKTSVVLSDVNSRGASAYFDLAIELEMIFKKAA